MGKKRSLIVFSLLCLMVLVGCEPDPPVQYTITYHNVDEATNPNSNPSSYTVESVTIQLSDPSRTGYTFAGWYASSNYSGTAVTEIPHGSTGTKALYAKWTANTYTVSFNSNDQAIQNPNDQAFIFGDAYANLPTPAKTYYGHTWNTVQDGSGTTISNATLVSIAENHTLYAQWAPTPYTITYTLNNGQNHASNPASYTIETDTITLQDPSRTGYSFGGWYTESTFTTQVTTIAKGSHDDITLHAKWTANTYTVTLDQQNGSGGSTTVTATFDAAMPTATIPNRTGYTFGGYYTSTNGGGTQYYTQAMASSRTWNIASETTLYAKWTPSTYTVTLDQQSGSGGSSSVTATYDAAMPTATSPTRAGYTFGGYYTAINGGGSQYYTQAMTSSHDWNLTSNTTLYAKWTLITYTLTYHLNNGTAPSPDNPTTYTIETAAITLKNPARTYYSFLGWYAESTFDTVQTTILQGSTGNKDFFAKWSADTYTIAYELYGGTNSNQNPSTYTIETNTITFADPTRTGYTFAGWFAESTYNTQLTSIAQGSHENKTLHAKWTANTYTLTLNQQSGSGGSTMVTATFDAAMPTATAPNRTGYTFGGYYISPDGGGTQYYTQAMASSRTWNLASATTLYAMWTPVTYNLTYHLNSGTAPSVNNPATYTIETDTITLSNPSRTGYTFAGWFAEAGFSTQVTTIDKGSSGDKALYAKWTPITYNLTYHLNSGTAPSVDNPATYTIETSTITLNNPSRTGYTFAGWYDNSELTGSAITQIPLGSYGNKDLFANWTANTYTVTFQKQSGTGGSDSVTATYAATMPTATNPTRHAYDFKGYFTAAEGGGAQYYTETMASSRTWNIASDTDLHAHWMPITYTLTYHLNNGTAPSAGNPATYTIETETITLSNPTRTGYTFAGWYAEAGFSTQVTTIDKGSSGDKALYAKWTPITYNLTYHLNSGTAPSPDNPATYTIETSTITLSNPARDYYNFSGWYSEPGFSNQVTKIELGSYGNKDLYAKWTPIVYSISYVLKQDQINHQDNPASYTIETPSITFADPTRTGYYFGGWYTESTLNILKQELPLGSHGDITLHPKWNYTYQVGDLTPAPEYGFIVFDRNSEQSTLDPYDYREASPWRYLVAANTDCNNDGDWDAPWTPVGEDHHFFNPATGGDQGPYGDVGMGLGATQAVVDYYGISLEYACRAASKQSGWFLPSNSEMSALIDLYVSKSIGNIVRNANYWTATDSVHAGLAYANRLNQPDPGKEEFSFEMPILDKRTEGRVRPFRRL